MEKEKNNKEILSFLGEILSNMSMPLGDYGHIDDGNNDIFKRKRKYNGTSKYNYSKRRK